MKVLLIEDDASISGPLIEYLARSGVDTVLAASLGAANEHILKLFDVILLDWGLPDGEGLDWLRSVRAQGLTTPIIFLTARADLTDRVVGLEVGANDYMVKPFEPRELLARIRVQARQQYEEPTAKEVGHKSQQKSAINVNDETQEVRYRGRKLSLTQMEYKLLKYFLNNPMIVLSREKILNDVWGARSPTTRTVDVHVMQLRQKATSELFETIHGIGYRFLDKAVEEK